MTGIGILPVNSYIALLRFTALLKRMRVFGFLASIQKVNRAIIFEWQMIIQGQ
jgi:hypothetical protein